MTAVTVSATADVVDAVLSADAVTLDDSGTAATLRRPSCVATSFIASTGSNTRPQPAGSQLALTTEPLLLLLLLLTDADDAAIFAADITPTQSHTYTTVLSINSVYVAVKVRYNK